MNIEIIRYRLPIYWIGALINGATLEYLTRKRKKLMTL